MQPYKVWWIKRDKNFGDLLTPYILDHFNIPYTFSKLRRHADIMSVGSIADRAEPGTIVLGSGILKSQASVCKEANWKFVRGPLTRNKVLECGGVCPEIYGDPGLLLSEIEPSSKKTCDVGLVPHFVDYEEVKIKYPEYKIINVVNTDPMQVAKEISSCKKIISSSLHGLICAQSYNIPYAWVKFNGNYHGDGIKFQDYYMSVGLKSKLSTVENPIYQLGKIDLNPMKKIFSNL